MDKTDVINFRDSLLLDGKNKSFRILFDNGIVMSSGSDMILWDDDNETVVGIIADSDSGSFEAGLPIRIICSEYAQIQFITSNTNVDNLETYLDALGNSGSLKITDENKEKILDYFKKVYDYRRDLSHKNYNPIDLKRGSEQVKIKEK